MLVVGGNMFKRSRSKFASSARSAPLLVDFLEPRTLLTAAPAGAILINAGGPAYTDSLGQTWQADTDFSGGSTTNETFAVANTSYPRLLRPSLGEFLLQHSGCRRGVQCDSSLLRIARHNDQLPAL